LVNPREILDFWFKQPLGALVQQFSSDHEFGPLMREKLEKTWRHGRETAVSQAGSMEDSLAQRPTI
jgi:hypothetical protein